MSLLLMNLGLDKPKKDAVCFLSRMERPLYPAKPPYGHLGNFYRPVRGASNIGPGCYNNEEKTDFLYQLAAHVESKKGYTLGARTAPRFKQRSYFQAPDPDVYQTHYTDCRKVKPSYKPFLDGSDRFSGPQRALVIPGPGTYNHDVRQSRHVLWPQSFGRAPVSIPKNTVQSTIRINTIKLGSTKEEQKFFRKLAYLKLYY